MNKGKWLATNDINEVRKVIVNNQIQIVTQVGQKVDCININIQKVKEKVLNAIDNGFKKINSEFTKRNDESLGNIFENIRNLFL
jgi:hypothetical protein